VLTEASLGRETGGNSTLALSALVIGPGLAHRVAIAAARRIGLRLNEKRRLAGRLSEHD
jgi:hypothetical protein